MSRTTVELARGLQNPPDDRGALARDGRGRQKRTRICNRAHGFRGFRFTLAMEGGPDMEPTQSEIVQKAIAVIDWGDTLQGLIALEGAPSLREIPVVRSYLGYCMAKERKQYREGIKLCESALAKEPHNAAHYLNLGRVYLLTRQKGKALATFRKGLSSEAATDKTDSAESPAERQAKQQALILAELRHLGIRRRSPFPSLPREHALNRIVGKMLARLQLR